MAGPVRIDGVGGAVVSTTHSAVPGSAALPAPSDAATVKACGPSVMPGRSSGLTQPTAAAVVERARCTTWHSSELNVKCAVVTLVGLAGPASSTDAVR